MAGEQVIHAKLADLHTFKGHPFRVLDDEKMEETTESIYFFLTVMGFRPSNHESFL